MPHRVADFFRSSTHQLENQVSNLAKKSASRARRKRDSPKKRRKNPRNLERPHSYAVVSDDDSEDDHAPPYAPRVKMADSRTSSFSSDSHKEHGHHHHRLSFPGIHFGRSSKDTHAASPATLNWQLESPPIVMYGDPESSTGALLSGQLFLDVKDEALEIESLNATLNIHVTQKKPFAHHCAECANQYTELKKWCLLPHPLIMTKGQHSFPFSVLLEGHLPATMDGPMLSIAYEFKAEAVPRSNGTLLAPIKLEKVLEVKRSLPASEHPHHSIRVFPPTNIKASVHYPHVIHPIGNYTLVLRLDGIAKHNTKVNTVEYWKLKKLTWKLEETTKTVAPACGRHSPKIGDGVEGQQKKGVLRSDTRVIGEKTLFSGWKSNYVSTTDSLVELELDYSLAKHVKSTCDMKSRDGTQVTHQLMVEMVVSQEWAPVNRPSLVTHTGVGRILRMHFGTILTERAGIGISWDNEAPPIYQDVPPSPPAYSQETMWCADSIADVIEPLDHAPREDPSRSSTDAGADRHGGASPEGR
ncbi:Endocytosis regulator [Madurella fahalii]|uniref:Endocytosis regulator n=1 Tax=Madurella fahalii TaxID=1157608 RepID=A0ABQ0GT25_9PEZI